MYFLVHYYLNILFVVYLEDAVTHKPVFSQPTPPPPVKLPGHLHQMHFDIHVKPKMSKSAKILVYYIGEDGEVVADSTTLKVQPCFKNKVGRLIFYIILYWWGFWRL